MSEQSEQLLPQKRLEKWQGLKSASAWSDLRGLLDTTLTSLLEEAENEVEALEAFSIILRTLAVSTSVVFDPHPLRPSFVRMDTSARNVGGDNPDAEYDIAMIDGDYDYLITGTRNSVTYLGFQILAGKGMVPRRHIGYIKDEELILDEHGKFRIILSKTQPTAAGNWVKIEADACAVIVRQYINNRAEEKLAEYHIELLDKAVELPLPNDEDVAARLIGTAWTMWKLARLHRDIPHLLEAPNQLFTMSAAQAGSADTTPDNTYMLGTFRVAAHEALIIDVEPPQTRYWNIVLENIWHECFDYLHRSVSVTKNGALLRADGKARFVISHKKPDSAHGPVNWLDAAGRERGFMMFRWLDTPTVKEPVIRLVALSDIDSIE
jgi:hypothetical protein